MACDRWACQSGKDQLVEEFGESTSRGSAESSLSDTGVGIDTSAGDKTALCQAETFARPQSVHRVKNTFIEVPCLEKRACVRRMVSLIDNFGSRL